MVDTPIIGGWRTSDGAGLEHSLGGSLAGRTQSRNLRRSAENDECGLCTHLRFLRLPECNRWSHVPIGDTACPASAVPSKQSGSLQYCSHAALYCSVQASTTNWQMNNNTAGHTLAVLHVSQAATLSLPQNTLILWAHPAISPGLLRELCRHELVNAQRLAPACACCCLQAALTHCDRG